MSLGLHNLTTNEGSKKRKKNRVGRGNSSGHGTYSTRGIKGQRARSGGTSGLQRKSLKMIIRRLPKFKGMKSDQEARQAINLDMLEKAYSNGETVDKNSLIAKKILSSTRTPFKILNNGKLTKKLEVKVFEISKTAKESIEKAGGKVIILEKPVLIKKIVAKK